MAMKKIEGESLFNKENVLICWNENAFASQMKNDGFKLVTSYSTYEDFKKNLSSPTKELNQATYKRNNKNQAENVEIKGIIVLCELTWGLSFKNQNSLSPLHAMSGIEFVMELRRNKFILPLVFVSFLNRQQQLDISSRNEIISTPILGHHYCQLPSSPEDWFEILNQDKKEELSPIELYDVKNHFCDPKGMLGELKHDLLKYLAATRSTSERDEQFKYVFKKIIDIIGTSEKHSIEKLANQSHKEEDQYNEKIKATSELIDQLIVKFTQEPTSLSLPSRKIKVVFLDDELHTYARLKKLTALMDQNGFEVMLFTDPDIAFRKVEEDVDNSIDLIISDHRIWDQSINPKVMNKMQGYSFLKKCSQLDRTYTYIVFSALDRNFLMTQFGLNTRTFYKNGILANESSMFNFIIELHDYAEENKKSFASKISSNKEFIKCLNWYMNSSDIEGIEARVQSQFDPILAAFKKLKKTSEEDGHPLIPVRCTALDSCRCDECGIYKLLGPNTKLDQMLPTLENIKSYYKRNNPWDPDNPTHVENFISKLAARRLFLYFYYSLRSVQCRYKVDIAASLLESGWIIYKTKNHEHSIETNLKPHKDFWLKEHHLKYIPRERDFLKKHDLLK